MKTLIISVLLCICAMGTVQAQIAGFEWFDGTLQYTAEQIAGGKIVMNAMDEGEEIQFALVPVTGKADTYTVTDGGNDFTTVYTGLTAKHMKKEGCDVIGLYNDKKQLVNLMENVEKFTEYYEQISVNRWKEQLNGTYYFPEGGGDDLVWGEKAIVVNNVVAPYEVVTFNGRVTGYIRVEGTGTILEGLWEVVPTLEGIHLYEINEKGDYLYEWERTPVEYTLKESNPRVGRFDYATNTLLTCKHFRHYKKSTLRIMRNAIMARNGYKFASKDLQDYFSKEPWYKPAASSDDVKLSFIEQMNIELIKAEEANPDHESYVKEP